MAIRKVTQYVHLSVGILDQSGSQTKFTPTRPFVSLSSFDVKFEITVETSPLRLEG